MSKELFHWSLRKGEQKKNHKYTKRELIGTKNGKNKYRYFYNNAKEKVKNAFNKLFKKVDKTYENIKESKMSEAEKKAEFYKNYYSSGNNEAKFNWDKVRNKNAQLKKANYLQKYYSGKNQAYGVGLLNSNEEAAKKYGKDYKYVGKVKLPNGKYRYFYNVQDLQAYYEKYGTETEKELMHKYGLKQKVFSPEEDMIEINEKRDYAVRGQYDLVRGNCGYCSIAYDLRRRGFDVEAANIDGISDSEHYSMYKFNDWDYDENGKYIGFKKSDKCFPIHDNAERWTNIFIKSVKSRYGDGSRGQLSCSWKNGGAHSMVWEINNGEVCIRDCQTNSVYHEDEIESRCAVYFYDALWYRTDDANVNPIIVENTKKNQNSRPRYA